MAGGCSTVLKHLTDQAKIEGLSQLVATGTRRYKMATNKSPSKGKLKSNKLPPGLST